MTPPQHIQALAAGNEVRLAAAGYLRDLRSRPAEGARAWVAVALQCDAEYLRAHWLGSIRVERLVRAIDRVGPQTSRQMIRDADIVGNPRLRDISPGRRRTLAGLVRGVPK